MRKAILLLMFGYLLGFYITDTIKVPLTQSAKADVAGMNRYDLRYDYEFKNAVKDIIEDDCQVEADGGISCW